MGEYLEQRLDMQELPYSEVDGQLGSPVTGDLEGVEEQRNKPDRALVTGKGEASQDAATRTVDLMPLTFVNGSDCRRPARRMWESSVGQYRAIGILAFFWFVMLEVALVL